MDAERSGVCSRGDEQCLKVRQIKNKKNNPTQKHKQTCLSSLRFLAGQDD